MNDYENKIILFLKFHGKMYPLKLEIVRTYKKLKEKNTDAFQVFIHKTFFPKLSKLICTF